MGLALAVAAAGCATGQVDAGGSAAAPMKPAAPVPTQPSGQIYRAKWLPSARITVDGRADEADWGLAAVEKRFVFPWKAGPAPDTEFRALCDASNLYFYFRVRDADIVVLDRLRDKQDAVFEDRVELFLSRDERMKDYYCIEVDSRGRVLDYRASFYRQFDYQWHLEGLETMAAPLPGGYEVEGRIPLSSLVKLGFPVLRPRARILCGLYRAEFSHDRSGTKTPQNRSIHTLGRKLDGQAPIEDWMSWVDPQTKEPDFHIPASLGWLEFVE
jgi:cellulose/xylan binding protein with CBM9 domain